MGIFHTISILPVALPFRKERQGNTNNKIEILPLSLPKDDAAFRDWIG